MVQNGQAVAVTNDGIVLPITPQRPPAGIILSEEDRTAQQKAWASFGQTTNNVVAEDENVRTTSNSMDALRHAMTTHGLLTPTTPTPRRVRPMATRTSMPPDPPPAAPAKPLPPPTGKSARARRSVDL